MFALVDVDNFYASCERLFRPDLKNQPIVVLSSNDGCVVARSSEAKLLGIKMGVPYFQIKEIIKKNKINVFSSNYDLYQELSNRLMNYVGESFFEYQVYSIDECFINLKTQNQALWEEKLIDWKAKVKHDLGLPVSIGLSQTKTLAKLAAELAKKTQSGFLTLAGDEKNNFLLFADLPLQEIWGLGPASVRKLNQAKILTVADFLGQNQVFIKQLLGRGGVRTYLELKGIVADEDIVHQSHSLQVSRSFGQLISDYNLLRGILAQFVQQACQKLRQKQQVTQMIGVHLATSYYKEPAERYHAYWHERLPSPSNSELDILPLADKILRKIYVGHYQFQKLGIICQQNVKINELQTSLFTNDNQSQTRLLTSLDSINQKYGKNMVYLGTTAGKSNFWQPSATWRSPDYLTDWAKLPVAK